MLRRRPDLLFSISATTRPARAGERDGEHYRFLTPEEFDRLEREDAFLETARVHGARYGTPRAPIEEGLRAGKTVILELDVQGARSIRAAAPDALLVFVEPPSYDELRARLESRNTEPSDLVDLRLRAARDELAVAEEFDHRIVNRDLEDAVDRLVRILDENDVPPERPGPPGPGPTQENR